MSFTSFSYVLLRLSSSCSVKRSAPLLGIPGAKILNFDSKEITPIDYQDTESYQITELFINNRAGLLNKLLNKIIYPFNMILFL